MTKNFIMLVGLPGSGKSTWTKNFLAKQDDHYVVISPDTIIEELGAAKGMNYSEAFPEFSAVATKRSKADATRAFDNGHNILWDQTNMTAKGRRSKAKRALDKKYTTEAVVFYVNPSELKIRLDSRAMLTGKSIPKHVMEGMARSYTEPTKEEGFDKITIEKK